MAKLSAFLKLVRDVAIEGTTCLEGSIQLSIFMNSLITSSVTLNQLSCYRISEQLINVPFNALQLPLEALRDEGFCLARECAKEAFLSCLADGLETYSLLPCCEMAHGLLRNIPHVQTETCRSNLQAAYAGS